MLYAGKTAIKQVNIYSASKYSGEYNLAIEQALNLVKQSELYDEDFKFNLFLDGGKSAGYLLKQTMGDAYAWGYYHNVVINKDAVVDGDWLKLRNYQRHFARTLAHEMIHCLEVNKLGWLHSKPLKQLPDWKWEGYAEYIAYKSATKDEKIILKDNIGFMMHCINEKKDWIEVSVDQGKTYTSLNYLKGWLMVKYLIDIKKFSFTELMDNVHTEETVLPKMMEWYKMQ